MLAINKLKDLFPELLKEWDFEKNVEININKIAAQSNKKVWWICSKNNKHTWQAQISSRTTRKKTGCPYCSNHKILKGTNDFATKYPELLKEWDYNKNTLEPSTIFGTTKNNIWWKCSKNHSWKALLQNRIKGCGCPYCNNKKVLKGFNDLLTKCPRSKIEWDYNKNNCNLENVIYSSSKKYWFICKNNHSYQIQAGVYSNNNHICPICCGRRVLKGYNDLASNYPLLLKEWDYNKNIVSPDNIVKYSTKKAWWKCSQGHSYLSTIYNKTANNYGCPICANKQVLEGYNDLLSQSPELMKEWDYNKNKILPNQIIKGSSKKVWWICSKGHSWEISPSHRNNGNNCPYCANKKVLKGYNDLLTKFPKLCEEWDYSKNNIKPDEIVPCSHIKTYWKCAQGHSWLTRTYQRIQGNNCPYCNSNNSFGENIIAYLLSNYYQVEQRKKHKINNKFWETDIYLPKLNIGIEFNGLYWHRIKEDRSKYDNLKEQVLSSKMKVFYILESDDNKIIGNKIYFNKRSYYKNLDWAIKELFKILNIKNNIDINTKKLKITGVVKNHVNGNCN